MKKKLYVLCIVAITAALGLALYACSKSDSAAAPTASGVLKMPTIEF